MTVDELLQLEEIKQLRSLYSHYYDGGRADELANLFTEDAVCEFGPTFGGDWVGKEEIRKRFAETMGNYGDVHNVMHAVTNPWIRIIDDETAHGRWYLLDLNTRAGTDNPLILFGIYDDVYKKRRGRWLFHRMRIDFLWPRRQYLGPREL